MLKVILCVVLVELSVAAWNCWDSCGKRGGPCHHCPSTGNQSGKCCRRGWKDPGCYGIEGCDGYHCCARGDCWGSCGNRGGLCTACGDPSKACCRKGWTGDPIECGKGIVGCSGYHCCVKQATNEQICGSKIDKNWKLVDIKYDVERGTISKGAPKVAGNQYVDNSKGTGPQSITFRAVETYTESKSFTHKAGVSVTVGTEFKCGIPVLAESKISVSVTASYEFTYGTTKTESKSVWASYTCTAPPGKKVRCKVIYNEFEMNVPYIATWERKDLPGRCKRTTTGIFTEVSAFDMHMYVDESKLATEIVE